MSGRIELPVVTEQEPEKQHVSLLIIADGLRQAEKNLQEQEDNIRKFSDQIAQLQNMRIASIAQKNLLTELQKKIIELEQSEVPQQ
jgi:hypothetical protein